MRYETFVAFRHMRSRKRSAFVSVITIISIAGVMLGVTALCVVLSVMSGFEDDLKDKILGTNAHLVVLKFGTDFTNWKAATEKVREVKGITGASPFILNEGMISSDSNLSGVLIKGIQADSAASATDIGRNMEAGDISYLDDPSKIQLHRPTWEPGDDTRNRKEPKIPGVIIGRELQKSLRVIPGDVINIFSPL
ncbi:MAG: ABC transporter permease, partial [Myxococcota bacterium]